jgi:hypothetical protein
MALSYRVGLAELAGPPPRQITNVRPSGSSLGDGKVCLDFFSRDLERVAGLEQLRGAPTLWPVRRCADNLLLISGCFECVSVLLSRKPHLYSTDSDASVRIALLKAARTCPRTTSAAAISV